MIDRFDGENAFLSNFYPCIVEFDGVLFNSVEHAFQAAKTLDRGERSKIRSATTPGQAKRLGRKATLRRDWESVRVDVMHGLLKQKFEDPDLRGRLLATGDQQLVEGNSWNDTFWGVCRGKGQNNLGKLLMQVRASLL